MVKSCGAFLDDLRTGARSLGRAKGLTIAVIATLALGIGANAAMFSLIRVVLLRPLVNRDEASLIYIRQSSHNENTTWSVPEIQDLHAQVKTLRSFGDFSTLGLTMNGLGEPRTVHAGVVSGSYFEVMGLRPVLGRLLDARDDGAQAAGAAVLTYRFWSTVLNRDPTVVGRTIRLGSFMDTRTATVVGVLEPCVPYPQDTEIIANIVTSAHHLDATMRTGRIHRMTELFGRLAPGADLAAVRAELEGVYANIKREYPKAYPAGGDYRISAVRLRDELTSGARTMLLVLMAASVLVFVIGCCNVANLILARVVRRENELMIRAALGASTVDLRRTLLAESLLLCVAGAALGIAIADPLVAVLARYASRYSVRALDVSLDWSVVWVGAGLAVAAAALLAFVPRLPSWGGQGMGGAARSPRVTSATNRKLKIFAIVQIAASFVLVAAAGSAVNTVLSLARIRTGLDTSHVLAIDVPKMMNGKTPAQAVEFYKEAARRVRGLPGVINVAVTNGIPWRDTGDNFQLEFAADGHVPASSEQRTHAFVSAVTPGYFATLGAPLLAGRDFTEADRNGSEPVAIVSETLARRVFPDGNAIGHHVLLTDPVLEFAPPGFKTLSRRIVGIVPDIDQMHLAPRATMTIYHPSDQDQFLAGGHLLVSARLNPYGLVRPITRILRDLSPDQPVERAATLEDVRAEVMSPDKLNATVSGVFAGVALLIAVVGVAGVLAFSVSGRTREFGIRLAVGSQPRGLLMRVVGEGAAIAMVGLAIGFGGGYWLAELAGNLLEGLKMPGVVPVAASAVVMLAAAAIASAIPAARAARIDVIQALRTE